MLIYLPFSLLCLGIDRLLGSGGLRGGWRVGGGECTIINFLRGLISGFTFENAQNVRGIEILRHRTGLLLKSCQTMCTGILRLKQINVSLKSRRKNFLQHFFVSNKM